MYTNRVFGTAECVLFVEVFLLARCPDFRGCNVHKHGVWESQLYMYSVHVVSKDGVSRQLTWLATRHYRQC